MESTLNDIFLQNLATGKFLGSNGDDVYTCEKKEDWTKWRMIMDKHGVFKLRLIEFLSCKLTLKAYDKGNNVHVN